MVEVIIANFADHVNYGGGQPLIHVHSIKRNIFGNEISVWVAGEMKIAGKEVVFAKELKLKTIQVLVLTPEYGTNHMYAVKKWVYQKGYYNNYASIDIFGVDAYQYRRGDEGKSSSSLGAPDNLPSDGSMWLNFIAVGE